MSDENMTNTEETAALFVSAQKKKKAEEEAKKKAAEEQARREAAEAEVRRMEQEVEERKRKAEEERIALEKAEQERAQKKAEMEKALKESTEAIKEGTKAIKDSAKEGAKALKDTTVGGAKALKDSTVEGAKALKEAPKAIKESKVAKKTVEGAKEAGSSFADFLKAKKVPILIGAGALVAVIVILIVVLSLGGSKEMSFEGMEFDGEIASSDSSYDIPIYYPSSVYVASEEENVDCGKLITLASSNAKDVYTQVVLMPVMDDATGGAFNVGSTAFTRPSLVMEGLMESTDEFMSELYEGAEIINMAQTETSDGTSPYFTAFDFTWDVDSGSAVGLIKQNGNGEYIYEFIICTQETDSFDNVSQMSTLFMENNMDGARGIPGYNEVSTNEGNMFTINEVHLGFCLSDQFEAYGEVDENNGLAVYADGNGGTFLISYQESSYDAETLINNVDTCVESMIDEFNKLGVDRYIELDGIQFDRRYESEYVYDDTIKIGCFVDFADTYDGVSYWERDHFSVWGDAQTGKLYYLNCYLLAPTESKAEYEQIFDNFISSMSDI